MLVKKKKRKTKNNFPHQNIQLGGKFLTVKHYSSSHLFGVLEVLLLTDVQQALFLDLVCQRFEAKLGTSGCQRLNNPTGHTDMQLGQDQSHSVFVCRWLFYVSWPADVVTDEAEAGGAGLLLHGPPESSLSWCRHGVGLIQDDDLKRRTWLPTTDTNKVRRSFRVC